MPIENESLVYSFPELRQGQGETEDAFKSLTGLNSYALPDKKCFVGWYLMYWQQTMTIIPKTFPLS